MAMTTPRLALRPDAWRAVADRALEACREEGVVARLRGKDHTLWKPDPREIADRLGWLDAPRTMPARLAEIAAVVSRVRSEGFTFALLLGMGGSSLAPEVFRKVFGRAEGFCDFAILDTTDPGAIGARTASLDLDRTLFIVATKSGGTVETFSLLRHFFNLAAGRFGAAQAGRHFIAITDPGSALADLARVHGFRHTFLNDPEIGGRYSALSLFGLFPAALTGIDPGRLLARAAAELEFGPSGAGEAGPGVALGAFLGEAASTGRDKLTFVFSPALAPFGDWVEQLIAESTGKEGRGILPVVGETLGPPEFYGADRLFVALRFTEDGTGEEELARLAAAGHPVVDLRIADRYDLGAQCFLWEVATAVAGWRLRINPFDQPDVEAAKALARKTIAEYRSAGALPAEPPQIAAPGLSVYGRAAATPEEAVAAFLAQAGPCDYVAIQAYLQPGPGTEAALTRLRGRIRVRFRVAVTVGYGPRFLHSTGQLHKGDGGKGLFLQLTADDPTDLPIPDELGRPEASLSFGILKAAQAAGDRQALINAGRRVLRVHLHADPAGGIERLAAAL